VITETKEYEAYGKGNGRKEMEKTSWETWIKLIPCKEAK